MDILKKNIRMSRRKSQAMNQITLEEDMNVPDSKADAAGIIQQRGRIKVEESKILENQILTTGYLEVWILYLSDNENHQVHRLQTKLPFTEKLNLEGAKPGDNISLKWEIEDIRVQLINSRKISIQALVTFEAAVEELYDAQAAVEIKDFPDISVKTKELHPLSMIVQKKDIFRIKDEISLASNKPNIGEILWENIQLRSWDVRVQDGSLSIKGELFVFVLYAADDEEGTRQWIESVVPFQGEIECAGCRPEMIPDIEVILAESTLEVRPDYDGEERILQLDAVLELDIRIYDEDTVQILEDVYAPSKELIPVFREETYESLLIRNYAKNRISDRIHISGTAPKLLQICHCSGEVKVDEIAKTEQGIRMEGAVAISVLYITADDDRPFALLEGVIPFSHEMEAEGIANECRFHLQPQLEQLTASMLGGEEVELKGTISLNLFAVRIRRQNCIRDIEEKELDLKKIQDSPGIVCYVVQPEDTLWDIAKKYYTTPERLKKLNQIKEEIRPGQKLLLVKSATV
ncbi:MAG: DUF3794 domain-containing protein [Lachnospiraceae bacterium]|nr:DUF3794 domain-containing protein [Lachnospiraceae bacterium]